MQLINRDVAMIASLAGRRLLITGAGSGIGLALASAAVSQGATVAATARDAAEADRLGELVGANRVVMGDLAESAGAQRLVEQAIGKLDGQLDGAVAAAGIFEHRAGLETALADWQRVLDINLTASFLVARAAASAMVAKPRAGAVDAGAMVLVSSQIGLVGHARAAAYAASKAGVNGLVKALAIELAPMRIRVNAVAPGPIATPMTAIARADPARRERLLAAVPLGRFGEAHEVAAAIAFLLSDAASFITGVVLPTDGGVTAV
jgi:NAD(P)-dependent dehydrogenase (short-subunit alcohol dehydrogenase family)